jgi:hypothetical protein
VQRWAVLNSAWDAAPVGLNGLGEALTLGLALESHWELRSGRYILGGRTDAQVETLTLGAAWAQHWEQCLGGHANAWGAQNLCLEALTLSLALGVTGSHYGTLLMLGEL